MPAGTTRQWRGACDFAVRSRTVSSEGLLPPTVSQCNDAATCWRGVASRRRAGMDVVLGVAVAGPRARLALVGSGAQGADVIDESVVDLADNPMQKLTETVIGTNRLLAGENHRLLATRLCWSDPQWADRLRRALEDSGVQDVAVLSEAQAARALSGAGGSALAVRPDDYPTVALARGAAMAAGLAGDATAMAPAAGPAGGAPAGAPPGRVTRGAATAAPAGPGERPARPVG